MSVNIASRQLYSRGFVSRVAGLLFETGLPGSAIELELREDVIAQTKLDHVMTSMRRLANLGVEFAFDDFGRGWSSIHQLTTFAGQRLKIDRRFVDQMLTDPTHAAVVDGMIQLAHGLGLRVVGEGIETAAQLDALVEMGCDELQGFHLGRPAPFGELEIGYDGLRLPEAS